MRNQIPSKLLITLFSLITAFLVTTNAFALDLKSWDNLISGQGRFVVLNAFDTAAVLDKETQLVWQRIAGFSNVSFTEARRLCLNDTTGGRKGWRLPTNYEITSLVDPAEIGITIPPLPSGHPFEIDGKREYWATSEKGNSGDVWIWRPKEGDVTDKYSITKAGYWCVRGQ